MCKYIAPLVQNNSGLKKGSVANVIIRDVRIIRNAKWGTKQGVTLLEFIFETQCNHIVVKKIPYSFDDNNEIHDIYEAATGKSFDVKRGFKVSEILDKTIDATVDKYIYRCYEGTSIIDFR